MRLSHCTPRTVLEAERAAAPGAEPGDRQKESGVSDHGPSVPEPESDARVLHVGTAAQQAAWNEWPGRDGVVADFLDLDGYIDRRERPPRSFTEYGSVLVWFSLAEQMDRTPRYLRAAWFCENVRRLELDREGWGRSTLLKLQWFEPEEEARTPEGATGSTGVYTGHVNDQAWWEEREMLSGIRQFARARRVSPMAVLGCVFCRVLSRVYPGITIPPVVGSRASLNYWVGLVGESGDGKTAAMGVAEEILDVGDVTVANPGSGEGVAASYMRAPVRKAGETEPVMHNHATLFVVGEVQSLTALGNRMGSTLWPELRKTWTGESLGFHNRSAETRLIVPAHAYRACMVVGVQPEKAGPLLEDANAGTPQRFLWCPTDDPSAPDEAPKEPATWLWRDPWIGASPGSLFEYTGVCSVAVEEIQRHRLVQLRRERGWDPMAGHRALTQTKTATVLAIMDGRSHFTEEDWALAAQIMAASDLTRERMEKKLANAAAEATVRVGEAKGRQKVVIAERVHEEQVKRVCRWAKKKITSVGHEWIAEGELRRKCSSRDRKVLDEALERLASSGDIQARDTGNKQGTEYTRSIK